MVLQGEKREELERKLQEYVGVVIEPQDRARDAVNQPMIRHWCEAMGDTNPAYLDPDAAKASVHGGIVAPPLRILARNGRRRDRAASTRQPHTQRPV